MNLEGNGRFIFWKNLFREVVDLGMLDIEEGRSEIWFTGISWNLEFWMLISLSYIVFLVVREFIGYNILGRDICFVDVVLIVYELSLIF